MPIQLLNKDTPLEPGDILLSRFDWRNPAHWLVAWATKQPFCHATLYLGSVPGHDGPQEWSVEAAGSHLRPACTDTVWAYRIDDPNWRDIGQAAAQYALTHTQMGYGWEEAAWVGVQLLQKRDVLFPLPVDILRARYCFEAVTDIFVAIDADIIPTVNSGVALGNDIATGRDVRL